MKLLPFFTILILSSFSVFFTAKFPFYQIPLSQKIITPSFKNIETIWDYTIYRTESCTGRKHYVLLVIEVNNMSNDYFSLFQKDGYFSVETKDTSYFLNSSSFFAENIHVVKPNEKILFGLYFDNIPKEQNNLSDFLEKCELKYKINNDSFKKIDLSEKIDFKLEERDSIEILKTQFKKSINHIPKELKINRNTHKIEYQKSSCF